MVSELIIGGVGILTTAASGFFSYLFTKKKYYTEVDHNVIENLEKSLKFYEELSKHNQEKLKDLVEENKSLRSEIDDLRKQVQALTTNLYLDSEYQKRVLTRTRQLENIANYAKAKDRLDKTEKPNRRRRKSTNTTGDTNPT